MARRPSRREFFSMATAAGLGALLASALARAQTSSPSYALYPDPATGRLKIKAPKGVDIVLDQGTYGVSPAVFDVIVRREANGDYVAYDRTGGIICKNSSTACIQEAVNYASQTKPAPGPNPFIGGFVFIYPGKYYVKSQITIGPHTHIRGAGRGATVIKEDPSRRDATPLLYFKDAFHTTISDLTVIGNVFDVYGNRNNYVSGADLIYVDRTRDSDPYFGGSDSAGIDLAFLMTRVSVLYARGHCVTLAPNAVEVHVSDSYLLGCAGDGFYIRGHDYRIVNTVVGNVGNVGFYTTGNGQIVGSKSYGSGTRNPNTPIHGVFSEIFIDHTGSVAISGVEVGEGAGYCMTVYYSQNVVAELTCYSPGLNSDYTTGGYEMYAFNIDRSINIIIKASIVDFLRKFNNLPVKAKAVAIQTDTSTVSQNIVIDLVTDYTQNVADIIGTGCTKNVSVRINGTYSYINVTTPSMPASGSAVANCYPVPVDVYIWGGAVTSVKVVRNGVEYTVFSSSSAVSVYLKVRLNNGDQIKISYTSAPSWAWVPASS
jgi:hypothetical protein